MHAVTAYDDYWCPAGEGCDALAATAISADDWIALLKVAHGDWRIPASELACLLERKLIEVSSGLVTLTPTGFIALGLPV